MILTIRNNCADAKGTDFNVLYSDNETLAKHSIFVLIKKKKTKFWDDLRMHYFSPIKRSYCKLHIRCISTCDVAFARQDCSIGLEQSTACVL